MTAELTAHAFASLSFRWLREDRECCAGRLVGEENWVWSASWIMQTSSKLYNYFIGPSRKFRSWEESPFSSPILTGMPTGAHFRDSHHYYKNDVLYNKIFLSIVNDLFRFMIDDFPEDNEKFNGRFSPSSIISQTTLVTILEYVVECQVVIRFKHKCQL